MSAWCRAREIAARTPATRKRFVNFLRAASITVVVFGWRRPLLCRSSNRRILLTEMDETSRRFVFTLAAPLVISLVWPLSAATAQQSASSHPATPQRPTFTTDTSVTTPGTVELELGGFFAENLAAR